MCFAVQKQIYVRHRTKFKKITERDLDLNFFDSKHLGFVYLSLVLIFLIRGVLVAQKKSSLRSVLFLTDYVQVFAKWSSSIHRTSLRYLWQYLMFRNKIMQFVK